MLVVLWQWYHWIPEKEIAALGNRGHQLGLHWSKIFEKNLDKCSYSLLGLDPNSNWSKSVFGSPMRHLESMLVHSFQDSTLVNFSMVWRRLHHPKIDQWAYFQPIRVWVKYLCFQNWQNFETKVVWFGFCWGTIFLGCVVLEELVGGLGQVGCRWGRVRLGSLKGVH